jgi:mono/diheme cytochrome c family protein
MNRRMILAAILAILALGTRAAAQATDAKALYDENCRKCHGVRGTPPKTMKQKYPKIATFDSAFAAAHSADSIVKVLTRGGKSEDMKSFKDKLTTEQMAMVAAYVQELAKGHP